MKKTLALLLMLVLAVSMMTCSMLFAEAEETNVEVTVGMKFEWNQGTDPTPQWIANKGYSTDKLWAYKVHPINRPGYYMNTEIVSEFYPFYAWNKVPGDTGLGYARAGNFGGTFHPGELADIVKVFYCPSGGTIKLDTVIRRTHEYLEQEGSNNTPTSLAIFVEDRKVFPEGADEYISISSIEDQTYSVTFKVAKNERVYIHIGAIGNQDGDEVTMSNTITYEEINSDVIIDVTDVTLDNTRDTVEPPSSTNKPSNNRPPIANPGGNDGPNVGLIIGIVAAVVVVVGVVAFIFIKKKKAE